MLGPWTGTTRICLFHLIHDLIVLDKSEEALHLIATPPYKSHAGSWQETMLWRWVPFSFARVLSCHKQNTPYRHTGECFLWTNVLMQPSKNHISYLWWKISTILLTAQNLITCKCVLQEQDNATITPGMSNEKTRGRELGVHSTV